MKRFELLFTFLQLPLDFALLVLAGLSAYLVRFSPTLVALRPIVFNSNLPLARYTQIVFFVALGWVIIFMFAGLYSANPNRKLGNELTRLVLACSTGFAGITIYVFFTLQKFDSRFLVLAGGVLAIVYVGFGRIGLRLLKTLLYQLGIGQRRTILVGADAITKAIAAELSTRPALGYKIIAIFPRFNPKDSTALLKLNPDELILTDTKASEEATLGAVEFASDNHITFKYSADLFATISTNMAISAVAGIPIIELKQTRLTAWGRIIKRLTDIVGGLMLLVLFSPFYVILAASILVESGRPIFYRNQRVGQYGKSFAALKFRSMYQKDCTGEQFGSAGKKALAREQQLIKTNSIKTGPVYKIKDDPRITPLGRFLRRWSLDELPQFINVLAGQMSLVGPRPHQPREVERYQKQQRIVLAIKPGVTGLPQISGRSNLSFEEEIRLDAYYMEHWSVFLDLIILLKTPFAVVKKEGAL